MPPLPSRHEPDPWALKWWSDYVASDNFKRDPSANALLASYLVANPYFSQDETTERRRRGAATSMGYLLKRVTPDGYPRRLRRNAQSTREYYYLLPTREECRRYLQQFYQPPPRRNQPIRFAAAALSHPEAISFIFSWFDLGELRIDTKGRLHHLHPDGTHRIWQPTSLTWKHANQSDDTFRRE